MYLEFSPYHPSEEPNSMLFLRPIKEPKNLFKEPNLAREQCYGQPWCRAELGTRNTKTSCFVFRVYRYKHENLHSKHEKLKILHRILVLIKFYHSPLRSSLSPIHFEKLISSNLISCYKLIFWNYIFQNQIYVILRNFYLII